DQLWIVALDGGRYHHDLRVAERGAGMADRNPGALVAQAFDIGAFGGIRTLHGVAEIDQDFGDTAHSDAADADEMDRADIARQFHCVFLPIVLTTRSANRSAASIAPCERAARAIATSFCGSLASALISAASRSGVKSLCWRSRAPPARSSTPALAVWS